MKSVGITIDFPDSNESQFQSYTTQEVIGNGDLCLEIMLDSHKKSVAISMKGCDKHILFSDKVILYSIDYEKEKR